MELPSWGFCAACLSHHGQSKRPVSVRIHGPRRRTNGNFSFLPSGDTGKSKTRRESSLRLYMVVLFCGNSELQLKRAAKAVNRSVFPSRDPKLLKKMNNYLGVCRVDLHCSNGGFQVKKMVKGGLSPDRVIEILRSFQDPIQALSFFKSLAQQPRIIHTTETCNFMLEVLRDNGRTKEMAMVFDFMQKQVIKRDMTTYLTLFKCLGVFGGIKEAPLALDLMSEAGFILNDFSYNGLIYILLQAGCLQEAMKIYRRMISETVRPSMKTYSSLMVASGKRKDIETVIGLLNEMEAVGLKPNVYTYTICIRVLGSAGRIDEAYDILKRMEGEGCDPDVVTYTVLMDALCSTQRYREAKELFYQMRRSNHKADAVTYTTLMHKFGDSGDVDAVKELWSIMEEDGYIADVVSYTILINALCKVNKVDEAVSNLDIMQKKGISLNFRTYNALIGGLLATNKADDAQQLFDKMNIEGPKPAVHTYVLFIDHHRKAGKADKALECFVNMKNKGIIPNIVACNVCLHALAESGRLDVANGIFQNLSHDGLSPDAITYSIMIKCYSMAGELINL